MTFLKSLVQRNIYHFSYFYNHLRYRIFIALLLSLVVGTLDGLGLAMFLPLLQAANGAVETSAEAMGNLGFLLDAMHELGISLTLSSVLLIILFFFSLKGMVRFVDSWYRVVVQLYFIRKLRFENINLLVKFRYEAFVNADVGRFQNTLSGEIGRVVTAYRSYFMAVQAVVMVCVYVVLAFLANPQFAFMVVAGAILSNQFYRRIYSKTKEASKKLTMGGHGFQAYLIQMVAFFKYLKATAQLEKYSHKLKKAVTQIEEDNRKMGMYNAVLTATREPVVIGVVVAVILVQVNYFEQSLTVIILSLLFFYRALNFMLNVQTNWNSFLTNYGALENMSEFNRELQAGKETDTSAAPAPVISSLTLRNITFRYDSVVALHHVNLTIKKNETIAFVGESGSGKTTVVNMLAGLIAVQEGEFLVGGISARDFNLDAYRKRIGYITQDPAIFSDTVFNNVTFWAEKTPENINRFWDALHKAAIADFVTSLPEKENAFLGNNGILVSGGQKQRFSIARELYKEVDILIMDEATSSLDSETEKVIQQNIDSLKGKYTILIVAHRLSTIKNSDRVVLMKKGAVEAIGDFESLRVQSMTFDKMVELQEF